MSGSQSKQKWKLQQQQSEQQDRAQSPKQLRQQIQQSKQQRQERQKKQKRLRDLLEEQSEKKSLKKNELENQRKRHQELKKYNDEYLRKIENLTNELQKHRNENNEKISKIQNDIKQQEDQLNAMQRHKNENEIEKEALLDNIQINSNLIEHLKLNEENLRRKMIDLDNRSKKSQMLDKLENIKNKLNIVIHELKVVHQMQLSNTPIEDMFGSIVHISAVRPAHFHGIDWDKLVQFNNAIQAQITRIRRADVVKKEDEKRYAGLKKKVDQEIQHLSKQINQTHIRTHKLSNQEKKRLIAQEMKKQKDRKDAENNEIALYAEKLRNAIEEFNLLTHKTQKLQQEMEAKRECQIKNLNKKFEHQKQQGQARIKSISKDAMRKKQLALHQQHERIRQYFGTIFDIVTEIFASRFNIPSEASNLQQLKLTQAFEEMVNKIKGKFNTICLTDFQNAVKAMSYDMINYTDTNHYFLIMQKLFNTHLTQFVTNSSHMFRSFFRASLIRDQLSRNRFLNVTIHEYLSEPTQQLAIEVLNDVIYPYDYTWVLQNSSLKLDSMAAFFAACNLYDRLLPTLSPKDVRIYGRRDRIGKLELANIGTHISYYDELIRTARIQNNVTLDPITTHLMRSSPYIIGPFLIWSDKTWVFSKSPFNDKEIYQHYDILYKKYFFDVMLSLLLRYRDYNKSLSVYYEIVLGGEVEGHVHYNGTNANYDNVFITPRESSIMDSESWIRLPDNVLSHRQQRNTNNASYQSHKRKGRQQQVSITPQRKRRTFQST